MPAGVTHVCPPPGGAIALSAEEHVARLEQDVEIFARHLADAQLAEVSHAIILPRLMLAFRRSFGEPPPGFVLPPGLAP